FTDQGTQDNPWSVDVDWGDNSAHTTFTTNTQGSLGTQTHSYASLGTFNVLVTVTDRDGGTNSRTFTVDVSPSVTSVPVVQAAANQSALEGTPKSFDLGSFIEQGLGDGNTWTVLVNWGDNFSESFTTQTQGALGSKSHTYADNGNYNVTVTVRDRYYGTVPGHDEVGWGAASFQVGAGNRAPSNLTVSTSATVNMGETATLTGSFTDPGTLDTHTLLINWGDGSASSTVNLDANVLTFSASHQYSRTLPGNPAYTISVTATDKDHDSTS